MPVCHIAREFGLRGPAYHCLTACAASSQAIGEATEIIRRGDAVAMLSGGSHSMIHPFGVTGFNLLTALSTRNDEPTRASRPFDRERDGFVLGEGAGILILESEEHAKARGADIFAELAGYGATDDAFHITQPAAGGTGALEAMRLAVQDAGMEIADVNYINAHGTSTQFNDKNESAAIASLFGENSDKLKISSTKSMTGHLLGAAGGIEAVASVTGVMMKQTMDNCKLDNPVPIFEIHGTADDISFFDGDINNSTGWGAYYGLPETIDFFVKK